LRLNWLDNNSTPQQHQNGQLEVVFMIKTKRLTLASLRKPVLRHKNIDLCAASTPAGLPLTKFQHRIKLQAISLFFLYIFGRKENFFRV
jgi:hypothetical protein